MAAAWGHYIDRIVVHHRLLASPPGMSCPFAGLLDELSHAGSGPCLLLAPFAPLRACWTSCRTRAPALAYWHPLPPCGPAGRVVARGLRPLPTGTLCPPVGLFCECRGCCKRVTANGAWILPESVLGLTRCSLPMGVSVGVGRVHGDRRGAMSENWRVLWKPPEEVQRTPVL